MTTPQPGQGNTPDVRPGAVVNAEGSPAVGDVPTWVMPAGPPGHAEWSPAAGGSQPNVVEFPIAFDDADLNDGVTAYTFAQDGWILDATFLVSEVWDGTTPLGDFTIGAGIVGPFGTIGAGGGCDMTVASDAGDYGSGTDVVAARFLQSLTGRGLMSAADTFNAANPFMPIRCEAGTVISVYVSQDGAKGGLAPGAMQGAAILMLELGFAA